MNLDNIKAAFFDLDGTLIDTEKIYVKCWKKAGDLCGYPMDWDRVYSLRSTDHQLAAERFKEYYGDDDAYMKIRAKRKEIMAEVLKTEKILPKKGVKKIVDFFKERGIKIAVVTASTVEVADDYMTRAGIRDLFDVTLSSSGVRSGIKTV